MTCTLLIMKTQEKRIAGVFHRIVANNLLGGTAAFLVWYALSFWAYLGTGSVVVSSIIAATFMAFSAIASLLIGPLVDRMPKRKAMTIAAAIATLLFGAALLVYRRTPESALLSTTNPRFWVLCALLLGGALTDTIRGVALSATVAIVVEDGERDRANGIVGTANGVRFLLTSAASGLVVGRLGMEWAIWIALVASALSLIDLWLLQIPGDVPALPVSERTERAQGLRSALRATIAVPGLMGLILLTTLNNLLGGVFLALSDPYGLSMVRVETWGAVSGFLSTGFIVGGAVIARKGLGSRPVRLLLVANLITWVVSAIFPLRSAIGPLAIGFFTYFALAPVIEAAEQTIIQRVVPHSHQGRVFGLAAAIETAAMPVMAIAIGPLTERIMIPWMTTGSGASSIGTWFGTGPVRAIALVFVVCGLIGTLVTLAAMGSRTAKRAERAYAIAAPEAMENGQTSGGSGGS